MTCSKSVRSPQKHRAAQRRAPLALAAGLALLVCSPWQRHVFAGGHLSAPRGLAAAGGLRATSTVQQEHYPELSRVEDLIYDSCVIMETDQEIECLRTWDKLKKFHKDAEMECNLDDLRCVVLDVLDRLCKTIDSKDGLILLNKVSGAVLSCKDKFDNWDKAFAHADTDNSGDLTLDELVVMMDHVGAGMTAKEVKLVFLAADANGDGVISREEFSDFLTAAVFAEEPLRELQVDSLPQKQPDFASYLHWSSAGRTQSWAGLAKLMR